MFNLGYACINTELAAKKISVNRSMIKRTFKEKGLLYAGSVALGNLKSLQVILEWNGRNNILFYRMSSDMFPWMSEYEIKDLPNYTQIKAQCKRIGRIVDYYKMRLTYHPGPFNVLASSKKSVVDKTIKELNQHAEIMDMVGLPQTPYSKINIHVGGAYGDKKKSMQRFCKNFNKLNNNVKKRLTIENDDRPNLYSVEDLYYGIYKQIGIPIIFDYLHYECHPGNQEILTSLQMAIETWPTNILPVVHYSSTKQLEDNSAIKRKHAEYIYENIELFGESADIMIEAKMKEQAVINYKKNFLS